MPQQSGRVSQNPDGSLRVVAASARSPRRRVLIVEDDLTFRQLIALALDETYDILHASTAAEALRIVDDEAVAAIVLDFRLPDATGLDVLAGVKAARPEVPVIVITGYGSESVCASAFKLGAWDYFSKPMNVLDVVESVRRALSAPPATPPRLGLASAGPRPSSPVAPGLGTAGTDVKIQTVIQLIQHHYWDHLSLSRLAREVGMSRSRLSHRFSHVVGLPLRTYLLRVRLERGRELLATSAVSISEVAQTVGFTDLPRFDKLFKRHTGLTPSAYRSRSRTGTDG
jgi:YesN/AraC family two-component response regulator